MKTLLQSLLLLLLASPGTLASDTGNRLTHLDEFADPYYVGLDSPRLVTPQWVGQPAVDAVLVLAIDDMREAEKYESFLRPILERLKRIDGRAPVSIMTRSVDPQLPQLQQWLGEGVSIEAHTYDHPCPCLQGGDLATAKATYDRCIDLLAKIPNTRPVAYRMPCCDSMNSVSPRFFTEVFNQTTPAGNFLSIDTSVFQLFTPEDPDLPRELVLESDGGQRFRKYLPDDRLMINYVENYPYPFVVARQCWELPCVMPSDWDGQHKNGKCSPVTVADFRAAIDATLIKQGVFVLCFHPHGWMSAAQVVELIDYAVAQYGPRVTFLNFQEIQQRLDQNLLAGHPLRTADGSDNGVRLCDVDGDGYQDVVVANSAARLTRIWSPGRRQWRELAFPAPLIDSRHGRPHATGLRFGVLNDSGRASVLVRERQHAGLWHFDGSSWIADPAGLDGLTCDGPVLTAAGGRDRGVRLRDLDRDGVCELIVSNPAQQAIFRYTTDGWQRLAESLPNGLNIVDAQGRDAGLRFVDLNEDYFADVVFSDAQRYAAYLHDTTRAGWSNRIVDSPRTAGRPLPMIVRGDGTNNGAWFRYGHMWVQNEDTGGVLSDHVDRFSFGALSSFHKTAP
jgi:peptidoglycan/xylan/chitin deacetylase (PgdA/CDA1 family)